MSKISDERREVAARLRGNIVYARMHDLNGDCAMGSDKCVETRCTLYNDIASCIEECGNFNLSAEEVFTRLADLIDPQERTCRITRIGGDAIAAGWYVCSDCGMVYPPCNDDVAVWALRYCPHCGARVMRGEDNE